MTRQRMKIKAGDSVIILTGADKKKTGKVVNVNYETGRVEVEGISQIVKHNKPSQLGSGTGSLEKRNKTVDISNLAAVHPTKKNAGSRVGYLIDTKGNKKRVYRQAGNKEIK